ncbi:hypothetical protein CR513_32570, partial [Mucuna pruriens]
MEVFGGMPPRHRRKRQMAAYIYDDKVLIHYFQDNLTRTALSWYVGLERGCIKTWRDLMEAFLK